MLLINRFVQKKQNNNQKIRIEINATKKDRFFKTQKLFNIYTILTNNYTTTYKRLKLNLTKSLMFKQYIE